MKRIIYYILPLVFAVSVSAQEYLGFPGSVPIKNGSVAVAIQNQYSESVDLYLCETTGETNPSAEIEQDDMSFTVVSASGATQYQAVSIIENGHVFQTIVASIDGTTINIGSRADSDFSTRADVVFGNWDFSIADGSSTPVFYFAGPPSGTKWDIYSIGVAIEDNAAMYESTFGGIAQLSNGIAGALVDGIAKQLFLISNNAGFREYAFETEYPLKVPSGTYAFWAKKNFPIENGVSLRLDGDSGDQIQIPIRDNLTDITKMSVTVHGHVVESSPAFSSRSVSIARNTWIKVIDSGYVGKISLVGDFYKTIRGYYVVVPDDTTAPTLQPENMNSKAVPMKTETISINYPYAVDVYVWSDYINIYAIVSNI
jgi:hypothetical protein